MTRPAPVPTGTTEPVSIAEAVRLVLGSIVSTVLARRRVVPLAKLR